MTREEAIEWLEDIKDVGCETMFRDWSYEVAIDMAIEALSNNITETSNDVPKVEITETDMMYVGENYKV